MRSAVGRKVGGIVGVVVLALSAAGCGGGSTSEGGTKQERLRLGFFPNLTHATALVGIESGTFARELGPSTDFEPQTFAAGPEAIEALFGDAVDATYIGPNPAVNAYARSKGEALRVVAGATSGGASLIVRPGIAAAEDLRGKKVASPQLGNTQDVALRSWLAAQGLKTTTSGGGDVSVVPQANADTLNAFRSNRIAGAWVPEPWATRLVQEGGGKVLVDERDLWPEGRFVTTHLVVRTKFLTEHPDVVRRLLGGHIQATGFLTEDGVEARRLVNKGIEAATGKRLPDAVIDAAWANLTFTVDPLAATLAKSAKDAQEVGLLDRVELKGLYDLRLLNDLLAAAGDQKVVGL